MGCNFCGGGDRWIKTCRGPDGARLGVCDPCYQAHAPDLMIVPGDHVVTARCDGCGVYGNPRDFPRVRPGGRKDAYAGVCGTCAEEKGVGGSANDATRTETTPKEGR